jgi:hypothetical protein
MTGRKRNLAWSLGLAVTGLGIAAFVARPAVAEPPSHGFHVHAPHPVLVPAPNNERPSTHAVHKPHPAQNPFTNPTIPGHAHKPHPSLGAAPPPATTGHLVHKPHPTLNVGPPPSVDHNNTNTHAPHQSPVPLLPTHTSPSAHKPHKNA